MTFRTSLVRVCRDLWHPLWMVLTVPFIAVVVDLFGYWLLRLPLLYLFPIRAGGQWLMFRLDHYMLWMPYFRVGLTRVSEAIDTFSGHAFVPSSYAESLPIIMLTLVSYILAPSALFWALRARRHRMVSGPARWRDSHIF